jgi:hypothetical protein
VIDNFRCGVCGGPRIPGDPGGEDAALALKEENAHLKRAARSTAAAIGLVATAATALIFLGGIALLTSAIFVKVLAFAVPALFAFLATRNFSKSTDAKTKAREADERAWLAAAEEIASKTKQGISAAELAKALQIEETRADAILTQLAVHDRTRIDVGDDAEVRYSVAPMEPRVRIGETEEDELDAEPAPGLRSRVP